MFDPPTSGAELYHTVVDVACDISGTVSTDDDVVQEVWSNFAGPAHVTTHDGSALHYYQNGVTFAQNPYTTVGELLANHNGQCYAWTDFFQHALMAHGIGS